MLNDFNKNKTYLNLKLYYYSQNIQDVNYTNLTSSSSPVINDESINSFTTISSESISRFSNFDFKPVIDLSNSPGNFFIYKIVLNVINKLETALKNVSSFSQCRH